MKNSFFVVLVFVIACSFVPCKKKDKLKVLSYTRSVVHAGMRGGMNGTIFKLKVLNAHNGISIDSLYLTYGYAIALNLESDRFDAKGNPVADADTLIYIGVVSDLQMADFTRNPLLNPNSTHPRNVDEVGYWTMDAKHHWLKLPPAKITAPINMP